MDWLKSKNSVEIKNNYVNFVILTQFVYNICRIICSCIAMICQNAT